MDFDILVQRVRQLEEYLKITLGQPGQAGPPEVRVVTENNESDHFGASQISKRWLLTA